MSNGVLCVVKVNVKRILSSNGMGKEEKLISDIISTTEKVSLYSRGFTKFHDSRMVLIVLLFLGKGDIH